VNVTFPLPPQTLAWLAGGLAGLIIAAYVLKLRRRRQEVPFSKLWQRVLRERDSSTLWRRLKRLVSLALQLAFVALLLGAALDPQIGEARTTGRNVVVILDASASMKAREGDATRLDLAKTEAKRLLGGLGGGDAALVIKMDAQATALTRFEADAARLLQTVDRVTATDTAADLPRALAAAADALRGRHDPMIVLVGDGAYRGATKEIVWQPAPGRLDVVDLTGIDVRFVPVGQTDRNVGIVAFNVRRYFQNKLSYEMLVEVQNFGPEAVTEKLSLYSGNDAVDTRTLTLAPGERQRQIYPDLGGGDERALRAHIEPAAGPADAFPVDDTAWALLPERKKQRALLVTADNLYLEAALLLDTNVTVDKLRPGEWVDGADKGYDAVIFDGFTPPAPPAAPALYFHPGGIPVAARGEIARPDITEIADHAVMRWVTLVDVNIDKASVLVPGDGDVVLAKSVREPIAIAGTRAGHKFVAFGFALDGTDLMLRVAFPVLLVNTLDWFAGDDAELLTTYRTGRVWPIPAGAAAGEVTVTGPTGSFHAPVADGRARVYGAFAGVYTVERAEGGLGVAANLADALESDIKPEPKLVLGGKTLEAPPAFRASLSRSIWVYLVLGALLLSAVEWLTYHRRVTV
jgi:hypothetical protein